MPFRIFIYKKPLCDNLLRLCCWLIYSGIISSGSFIHSYLFMGLLRIENSCDCRSEERRVANDFGIKYERQEDISHLLDTLQTIYTISEN